MATGDDQPDESESAGSLISHTGADEAWATRVAAILEAGGRSAQVQAWDLPAGDNFALWINRQMDAAQRTVPPCSPVFFASSWRTQEWAGVLAVRKVIPLGVADCRLPPVLATIACWDLLDIDEPTARGRRRRSRAAARRGSMSPSSDRSNTRDTMIVVSHFAANARQHDMLQHANWLENYGRFEIDMSTHLDALSPMSVSGSAP